MSAEHLPADDCFAARLAAAFSARFGGEAAAHAAVRLARASVRADTVKFDLFTAVTFILNDHDGIFNRSRSRPNTP